jgi:bacteriorhodopsin
MKHSMSTLAKRGVLATSSRRTEWSWCGFGAGLLGYVVLSAVFGTLPDDPSLKSLWLALGLAPAFMGLGIGFTLASVID